MAKAGSSSPWTTRRTTPTPRRCPPHRRSGNTAPSTAPSTASATPRWASGAPRRRSRWEGKQAILCEINHPAYHTTQTTMNQQSHAAANQTASQPDEGERKMRNHMPGLRSALLIFWMLTALAVQAAESLAMAFENLGQCHQQRRPSPRIGNTAGIQGGGHRGRPAGTGI